jgi:hypothetical protein
MRVRFKKDSAKNITMYEGTVHEFTFVSMGRGFTTDIKNTINWDNTPEGELVEAEVPNVFMLSAAKYIEYKQGNNWITPKAK